MEINFSDQLNASLAYSREEALRTGNYGIGPDQMLLGILRHGENSACRIMEDAGVVLSDLKEWIDERITTNETIPFSDIEKIGFSRIGQNIISLLVLETRKSGCDESYPIHLLLALLRVEAGYGANCLRTRWQLDYDKARMMMENSYPPPKAGPQKPGMDGGEEAGGPAPGPENTPVGQLMDYANDITQAASEGKLDPVHGRDAEIDRVIQILGRRRKNNAMLVGDPGVGKTAIVEGIALRIVHGQVPESMAGKRIVSLDLAAVVAGTKFRGDFEKRLKGIIEEIRNRDDIILFIDEFHTIVGAGKAEGSLDAANILKPALSRGEIQCIGATTIDEFTKYIEKDGALDRRFQKVMVEKTDMAETEAILRLLCPKYEQHHRVRYSDEALACCVSLSERYITTRCLPDKAVDVMDEAGSMVHIANPGRTAKMPVVGREDIEKVISRITGIPVGKIARSEGERLLNMSDSLKKVVVGQDEAVDKVCKAICRGRSGIKDPDRPIGSFVFFGPTGVGKTLLAKSLAEYLFDSSDCLVRIDMSEYMEKFAVSRLIGAPPGYVGFDDNGQLTEPVRQHPYCVVLLDEIEKAHPDIFNLLLQVMDEGCLTDSKGRKVSFRNTVVIMTSNVGSREVAERGGGVGFDLGDGKSGKAFNKSLVDKAVSRTFPPEFLGRLDDRIFFRSLEADDIDRIIDLEIKKLQKRVEDNGFTLKVSAATRRKVASEGFNPRYGARPLRKAIMDLIEDPVSEMLIQRRLASKQPSDKIIRI